MQEVGVSMTIKFQKIIRWIPLVNLLTVFCALVILIKKHLYSIPIKPLVKVFVLVALLTLPKTFVEHFFHYEWLLMEVHYLSVYFQLYFISSFGIEIQEEVMKNEKK